MDEIYVCKFGGTSVNSPSHLEKIVRDDPRRRVVVVSAPGKRGNGDEKVTDLLIRLAETGEAGLAEAIMERYRALYPEEPELVGALSETLCQRLSQRHDEEGAYLDSIKAFGEEASAKLFAKRIGAEYIAPPNLLRVSPEYGNTRILAESEEMIRKRLGTLEGVVVIPGFYGYTEKGSIATLSRGGSDLTGSYIAAALSSAHRVKAYENFTDTKGVYAADPGIVENPRIIEMLTYDEIRDLSYSGFNVFHEEAMNPAGRKGVPIHVRGTFSYPDDGTYIVQERPSDPGKPVVGVAYRGGLCSFNAVVFGLNKTRGIVKEVGQTFMEKNLSIDFITTGIDNMSIILTEEMFTKKPEMVAEIINELRTMLGEYATVSYEEHLGSLVVVGKGLRGNNKATAGILTTLDNADIGMRFISQSPEEGHIIYGINSQDSRKAVNAIYDAYIR